MRTHLLHFLSLAASLGSLVKLAHLDSDQFPHFSLLCIFRKPQHDDVPEFRVAWKCLARIAMLVAGMFVGRGVCRDQAYIQTHNLVVAWFDCLCQRSVLQLHAAFEDRFSLHPESLRDLGLFLVETRGGHAA